MVRRAVWDYVQYQDAEDESKRQHHLSAKAWFFDETEGVDEDGRVSFRYLCDVLGIDPGRVLVEIKRLTRAQIKALNNRLKDE